jgi:Mat/Ecp fimbriae major subunit
MNMKRTIVLLTAIIMMAGFTGKVMAQVTLTGNTAGATLVEVLTIANTVPLNFGVIGITAGTAGTVTMNTAGLRTPDAGTTTIIATGTPSTVAQFDLTGTGNAVYTINLPLTIAVATGAGLGDLTMDIDNLMVNVDGAGEATAVGATGTLTLGASTFLLGGTLNISATQQIGVYAGTYDVTVDYQ